MMHCLGWPSLVHSSFKSMSSTVSSVPALRKCYCKVKNKKQTHLLDEVCCRRENTEHPIPNAIQNTEKLITWVLAVFFFFVYLFSNTENWRFSDVSDITFNIFFNCWGATLKRIHFLCSQDLTQILLMQEVLSEMILKQISTGKRIEI